MIPKIMKIVKKCKVSNYPQWGGYLQPSEILALVELGVKVDKFHQHQVEYAKQKKAKGESNPTWFYFNPNNAFLKYTK